MTSTIQKPNLRAFGLLPAEYEQILAGLGREPNLVELGMLGAMWSEHCGYKHSRKLLKLLPSSGPRVLQGPGENAGAVDIGDGLAVVLKMESHNHPSAVEPFQGAATGVGGILRDIFTMGARPVALLDSLRFGDPTDPRTEIGPLVTRRQQERVQTYIALGQKEGARVVVGGNGMPKGLDTGWYVQPTVFADVNNGMRIAQEEIFGPVLTVIPFDDIDDAVRIANDSRYGLAGTVWTADAEQGTEIARRIRTGSVGINQYMPDLGAPLGGFKNSGIGREGGAQGLDQYVELQSTLLPPRS